MGALKYVEELQAIRSTHYQPSFAAMDIDEGESHLSASSIGQRPEAFPSPLLATVIEQLAAKLRAKLLSASDALALFSYVRILLLRIASKSADLALCKAFGDKVFALVEDQTLFHERTSVESAIRREVALLRNSFDQLEAPVPPSSYVADTDVQERLTQIEKLLERELLLTFW